MILRKGSKRYVMATIETMERMLKEIKAEVSQAEGMGVKPWPPTKTNTSETPDIHCEPETKIDPKDKLKPPAQPDAEPSLPSGYKKEEPDIHSKETEMAVKSENQIKAAQDELAKVASQTEKELFA